MATDSATSNLGSSIRFPLGDDGSAPPVEVYALEGRNLIHRLKRSDGSWSETVAGRADKAFAATDQSELRAMADAIYLRSHDLPKSPDGAPVIRIADLFSGLGSLSLGVFEAARALKCRPELILAADNDPSPLSVLQQTFGVEQEAIHRVDLSTVLSAKPGPRTTAERNWLGEETHSIDVLVAGPPCQGHSRLNNHTRHNDDRNDLYSRVIRFIELERPRLCVIENVDSVVHDQRLSVDRAADWLRSLDYSVSEGRVSLHDLGVPQKRRRHVLVATRKDEKSIEGVEAIVRKYAVPDPSVRNLEWAISDLVGLEDRTGLDEPGKVSDENKARIRYLHEAADRFNLPNSKRPPCHQRKKVGKDGREREHSYRAMYGKLKWDEPTQTITSGYGSMGQGRYVHPSEERTLTPHEAARLQFIPDFVPIGVTSGRGRWAKMIGNVAPLKLSYIFAAEFLR
jgi:DNA (cytosine-5)-methyltransferase 1